MDLVEAVKGRRSIRRFKPTPIPEEDLREIASVAALAPSAKNVQMWQFWAVTDRQTLLSMRDIVEKKIEEMAAWPEARGEEEQVLATKSYNLFFAKAPACFVVLRSEYQSATDKLLQKHGLSAYEVGELRGRADIQSIGGAVQTLLLAAYNKGYGTCWMTGPLVAGTELERLLKVPEGLRIAALVPIGVPAEEPVMRPRKPLDEVFRII